MCTSALTTNIFMPTSKKPTSSLRDLRISVPASVHADTRMLRAQTEFNNADLYTDMMRVYKKHPNEWATKKNQKGKAHS